MSTSLKHARRALCNRIQSLGYTLNVKLQHQRNWTFIHINFTFLLKYAQSHSIAEWLWGTQTDRWSADYSIDQGMVLPLSALCLHGSHAVNVAARRGWGISWYPSHSMRSTAVGRGYCSLACDANHVTWSDWWPGYVTRFRNLLPSLRAHCAAEMGVCPTVL